MEALLGREVTKERTAPLRTVASSRASLRLWPLIAHGQNTEQDRAKNGFGSVPGADVTARV